jgi:hypothetical protein
MICGTFRAMPASLSPGGSQLSIRDPRARSRSAEPGGCAGFVAFLLLAAATLLIAATAALASLVSVVLGPSNWLRALDASGAYDQAPDAIADQLSASIAAGGASGGGQRGSIGPLDAADVRALVAAALPAAWLREQAQVNIPPVVEGLAATGEIRGQVSLLPLKAQLTGAPLQAAALDRIATWPACTAAQLQQLAGGNLVRCHPPAGFEAEMAAAAGLLFVVVAAGLPDSIDLARVLPGATGPAGIGGGGAAGGSAAVAAGIVGPLRMVAAARPLVGSLVLVMVVVLAAAILFSGLTIRSTLRALAIPLLLGGAFSLAAGWLATPVLAAAVNAARTSVTSAGGVPGLVAVGGSLATAMIDQLAGQILPLGLALPAAGLLLLLIRLAVTRG